MGGVEPAGLGYGAQSLVLQLGAGRGHGGRLSGSRRSRDGGGRANRGGGGCRERWEGGKNSLRLGSLGGMVAQLGLLGIEVGLAAKFGWVLVRFGA